jgi:hypothetical protein
VPGARNEGAVPHPEEVFPMTLTAAHLQPLVALIAGILILVMPRLLNFIVAIYLIIIGLIGLGIIRF